MGVSTDAVMFYGYAWKDEDEGHFPSYEEEDDSIEGVSWGRHCCIEAPMAFLSISKSQVTAWRGSPRAITDMSTPIGWRDQLDRELERLGIDPPSGENQPGWWIASWRG